MIVFLFFFFFFLLHSFFQCFRLTVFEAWPFFRLFFFATLASITDFALGTKGLTRDESVVVVTTADGGNVVAVVLLFFLIFDQTGRYCQKVYVTE